MASSRCATTWRRFTSLAAGAALLGLAAGAAQAAAPGDFKAEYEKGVAAYGAGDYATALAQFEKAYKLKAHPLCLFNMGQAHRKMEHIDEAIAAYNKYLATKPAPDLKAETEGYLADLAKAKEARVEADEARRLSAAKDYAGAAGHFEKAYAIRAEPSLLFSTGQSYELAGNKTKAIEFYERFLKTDTDPKLRTEAESALKKLREEPDAAGRTGPPPSLLPDAPGDGAGEKIDDPVPPSGGGGSKVVLFAAVGGGAAVVVAVVVVVLVVVTGGPKKPDSDLGLMDQGFGTASF
jgi:tetratricopeptide (TPR) repeat protein